ncbi:hypothetical protein EY643_02125 [Halioglobus maricola]|uniref:Uncharacterized protein n=1 Tax=Halioglobus maricola TaxID=2601894 RepID=A0A5P9NFI1_9GAMM|nr:hypothetical protein [Halioglobus maricola]QFU74543.1 hypothetical protein EY643_02125 [Halioglobus maricola]
MSRQPLRQLTLLAAVLMLFGTNIATAQDADDEPPETDTAEPASTNAESDANLSERGSPFDYEASEQISEDLSVSFPVDI